MFDKEIEFSAHEDYFALKEDYPTPIKLNIPEWFKKLEHNLLNKTVKGCMPFLDTLTSGYLLKMPQDFKIEVRNLYKFIRPKSLIQVFTPTKCFCYSVKEIGDEYVVLSFDSLKRRKRSSSTIQSCFFSEDYV